MGTSFVESSRVECRVECRESSRKELKRDKRNPTTGLTGVKSASKRKGSMVSLAAESKQFYRDSPGVNAKNPRPFRAGGCACRSVACRELSHKLPILLVGK